MRADTAPRSCQGRRGPLPTAAARWLRPARSLVEGPAPKSVEGPEPLRACEARISKVVRWLPLVQPRQARAGGAACSLFFLPIHLRAELNLTRRVAHARDAREVPGIVEVQRSRRIERREVGEVERFDP